MTKNLSDFKKYKGVLFKALDIPETTGDITTVEIDGERTTYSPTDFNTFNNLWEKTFNDYLKEKTGIETEKDAFTPESKKILNNLLQGKGELFIESHIFHQHYDKSIGSIVIAGEQEKEKSKRSKRAGLIIGTSTLVAGLCLIASLGSCFSNSKSEKTEKAPTTQAQKAESVQMPEQFSNTPPVSNTIVPENNQAKNTSTNNQTTVQQPVKNAPNWLIANRPISGSWTAKTRRIGRDSIVHNAFEIWLIGEFNDIYEKMSKRNLRCQQIVSEGYMGRQLNPIHNQIIPATQQGQEQVAWFIDDMPEAIKDLKNYVRNLRDVLSPLTQKQQMDAMRAFGPAMGFSVTAQMNWQENNPKLADDAYKTITALARQNLSQNKADTNDVKQVMNAVLSATETYRQTHPENQALFLTADKSIRKIADIKEKDLQKYNNIEQENKIAKQDEIEAIKREPVSLSNNNPQYPTKQNSDYPWWKIGLWVIGGAVLGTYLFSEHIKKKNKVI